MRKSTIRSALASASIFFFTALLASCGVQVSTSSNVTQPTAEQASRLLTQATFGPTVEDISRLESMGTAAWFNDQFSKPQTLHLAYMNNAQTNLAAGQTLSANQFYESFWKQAITGDDQLRQRVTYALSQIFVISFQNTTLASMPRGVASYYDTLGAYAFGNFRDLLQAVTLHPMMGMYLSSLGNQKKAGAREPDQNYAREVMQLFTIGLEQLNVDGTDTGNPTYTNDDIVALANVFTGWSWAGPDQSDNRFYGYNNPAPDPNRDWLPMQNYSKFHETAAIACPTQTLGINIPPGLSGADSLKIALDALFNNPNVGYFIGRQLIQRLVISNPSPNYIGRVAAVFNNNGQGVRGDMKAVIKAVLLDPEAMTPLDTSNTTNGKLREPVIRLANWMRAFHVNSSSGRFPITNLDNTSNALGQTPMNSPTVFNFYRPDYQPPNSKLSSAALIAPEMQITDETSVIGYLNLMKCVIQNGVGSTVPYASLCSSASDIKANYTSELALAANPDLLVNRISLLLMQNQMSPYLHDKIVAAITSNTSNTAINKVYLAIYLAMASPEYLVQK